MTIQLRTGTRRDEHGTPDHRRRHRVLHVITHLDEGGAQDNTLLTVEGLDRKRYAVDVLAGPGVLENRAAEAADHLIVLPYFRRPLLSPGDIRVFWTLLRIVRSYDVIHTHGSKAGILGRLAARVQRVPVVVHTVHGFPVHPLMSRPVRGALLAVERVAARTAHAIVCVCEANAREALELGIAEPEQVRVVVSGVPEQALASGRRAACRAALGIPADAPVVGTVTRLMEQKAPLDFVAAARTILTERPDAHVLLVGDGHLRAQVEDAAADLPRLHLLGRREDIPDLLAAMDVVAFSSLWEGLGRALTEAVLAGRPVVATAVNGVPDLIDDGVTGHLVPAGQPDLLARRVLDVFRRPDRGRAMGEAGADRVRGKFDVGDMVTQLDLLYQEQLAAARRPGR